MGWDVYLGWRPNSSRNDLADSIRQAIRAGRLPPGTALPSTRALAEEIGLARGTITKVYDDLAAEGYLRIRQGARTSVADSAHFPRSPGGADEQASAPRWDLHPCGPGVFAFPRKAWLTAVSTVVMCAQPQDFDYADERGPLAARAAVARYVARARGVVASPDRVVLCGGFSHGMSLLAGVLREQGVTDIAFEDPSSAVFRTIAAGAGLRIVGVPVDKDGIRVSDVRSPAVVITPAHQYPMGVPLSDKRRERLARWAAKHDGLIIEDDYDGEFRFDRVQFGALQALAPECVVYTGTASKTLAPAVRLGWLVLPCRLVDPVRAEMIRTGWRPPVLEQLAFAEMIESGAYDKHIRSRRAECRRRRGRLLAALPHLAISGQAAGLHVLAMLPPDGPGESEILKAAEQHSLRLAVLGDHWISAGQHPAGVLIGYATPAQHAFGPTLDVLRAVLST